jgi:hypothetical protein
MLILHWVYFNEVVSKYTKSILAYTENVLKEYKLIRKIRQEYFAVCREYTNLINSSLSVRFFLQNQKNQILNHAPSKHEQMGKNIISRYGPFSSGKRARQAIAYQLIKPGRRGGGGGDVGIEV